MNILKNKEIINNTLDNWVPYVSIQVKLLSCSITFSFFLYKLERNRFSCSGDKAGQKERQANSKHKQFKNHNM